MEVSRLASITRSERVDLRVLQSEPPAHASHRNRLKTIRFCLSYLSTATIRTTAKSSAWKRGLTSPHSLRLSPRDGRQQPKQKSRRSTARRLAIHDNSTYFLMPLWTTCPGREASSVSWALRYQSPTKKMPHRLASRPTWWKHFLRWGSSSQRILVCVTLTRLYQGKVVKLKSTVTVLPWCQVWSTPTDGL